MHCTLSFKPWHVNTQVESGILDTIQTRVLDMQSIDTLCTCGPFNTMLVRPVVELLDFGQSYFDSSNAIPLLYMPIKVSLIYILMNS